MTSTPQSIITVNKQIKKLDLSRMKPIWCFCNFFLVIWTIVHELCKILCLSSSFSNCTCQTSIPFHRFLSPIEKKFYLQWVSQNVHDPDIYVFNRKMEHIILRKILTSMWLQYLALDTIHPLQIVLSINKKFAHNTSICSCYTVAHL